jgi:hypothetical protein
MPIARTRALNATPNDLSLSRMRCFGALSQGNASVICWANHSAIGLRGTATTTTIAGDGREQETRIVAERQSSEPQTQRVLKTHSSDEIAYLFADPGSAPGRTRLPAPVGAKAQSMPPHNRLGPDDSYSVKNARTATIEPNEQSTVDPTRMHSTSCALLQNIELMPQYQDFGFQP